MQTPKTDFELPTAWQTIGPFFHFALTDISPVAATAEGIRLVCRVRDGDDAR